MFRRIFVIMALIATIAIVGLGKLETVAADPTAEDTVKIYDVVETYDNTMVIETENGIETLQFDGMTQAEAYALHVIFVNGEYAGIAD